MKTMKKESLRIRFPTTPAYYQGVEETFLIDLNKFTDQFLGQKKGK